MVLSFYRRWIFNISHATLIGFAAELLACKCNNPLKTRYQLTLSHTHTLSLSLSYYLLSVANVGLGIALLESGGCSPLEISQYRMLWLYIAFVCFLVMLQVSLFFIFTLTALNASPESGF